MSIDLSKLKQVHMRFEGEVNILLTLKFEDGSEIAATSIDTGSWEYYPDVNDEKVDDYLWELVRQPVSDLYDVEKESLDFDINFQDGKPSTAENFVKQSSPDGGLNWVDTKLEVVYFL